MSKKIGKSTLDEKIHCFFDGLIILGVVVMVLAAGITGFLTIQHFVKSLFF